MTSAEEAVTDQQQLVKCDMDSVCRICMAKQPLMLISLFQINQTEDEVIANMIIDCCEVLVSDDDNLPQNVCSDCLDRLNQAYELRKQCKRSDEVLRGSLAGEDTAEVESESELEIEYLEEFEEAADENADESVDSKFVERIEDFPAYKVYHLRGVRCCGCFKLFEDADSLMNHFSQDHGRDTPGKSHFQCDGCREPFDSHLALTKHQEVVQGKTLYHCKRCQLSLQNKQQFLKHVLSENGHEDALETLDVEGRFDEIMMVGLRCCGCDEIYDDEAELERHQEEVHRSSQTEGTGFECTGCYKRFKYATHLTRHQVEAKATQFFVCSTVNCKHKTIDRNSMISHVYKDHGLPNVGKTPKKTDDGYACCVLRCYEVFQVYEDLEYHAEVAHAMLRIQHDLDRKPEQDVTCDICHRGFLDDRAYARHRTMTDKNRKHVCEICGAQYAFRSNLAEHERSNCGQVARYKCNQCEKAYLTPGGLKNHRKTHKDQRSFVCEECGRAFLKKSILKDHINTIHSSLRAFQCPLCPKSFTSGNIYRSHQLTHTKEKPYQCRHCEKRYFKSSDRKMHENQVHLGNRPFKCQYCKASFIRDRERRLHERVHTRAKLYTCEHCTEGFNKFAEFKKHRREQHGIETLRDLGPAAMAAVHGQSPAAAMTKAEADDEGNVQFEFFSVEPDEDADIEYV